MAIACTALLNNFSGTNATSYVTASFTLSQNALGLILVNGQNASFSGTAATPTISGWTQVDTDVAPSPDNYSRSTLFRRLDTSGDVTGTVTIDFGATTQDYSQWAIVQVTGLDTGGTNGATAIVQTIKGTTGFGSTTSGKSLTLGSSITAGNATLGAIGLLFQAGAAGATPGSGYTEIVENTNAGNASAAEIEFRTDGQTTVNWTWTLAGVDSVGFGLELKAASAGGFFSRYYYDMGTGPR